MPVNEPEGWHGLGAFEAASKSGEQVFELEEPSWARYLKVRAAVDVPRRVAPLCCINMASVLSARVYPGILRYTWERERCKPRHLSREAYQPSK